MVLPICHEVKRKRDPSRQHRPYLLTAIGIMIFTYKCMFSSDLTYSEDDLVPVSYAANDSALTQLPLQKVTTPPPNVEVFKQHGPRNRGEAPTSLSQSPKEIADLHEDTRDRARAFLSSTSRAKESLAQRKQLRAERRAFSDAIKEAKKKPVSAIQPKAAVRGSANTQEEDQQSLYVGGFKVWEK